MNRLSILRRVAPVLALLLAPFSADADVQVRLSFAYQVPGRAAPSVDLAVTDLLRQSPHAVQVTAGEAGVTVASFTLTEADFVAGYARLRLVVDGLRLPPEDAKADQSMQFAFEMLLRRSLLADVVDITVPVVTSSRKGALKPFMDLPQIAEDLPARYLMAEQWMALYQASPEAVAAAPASFALHRLISRALVDFAIAMADQPVAGVRLMPSQEMKRTLDLYWNLSSEGGSKHLRAYRDSRTALWKDAGGAQDLLRTARRSGIEAAGLCDQARKLIAFFAANPPPEDDQAWVDQMFPNPGTLQGYLDGRSLDIRAICTRLRI